MGVYKRPEKRSPARQSTQNHRISSSYRADPSVHAQSHTDRITHKSSYALLPIRDSPLGDTNDAQEIKVLSAPVGSAASVIWNLEFD